MCRYTVLRGGGHGHTPVRGGPPEAPDIPDLPIPPDILLHPAGQLPHLCPQHRGRGVHRIHPVLHSPVRRPPRAVCRSLHPGVGDQHPPGVLPGLAAGCLHGVFLRLYRVSGPHLPVQCLHVYISGMVWYDMVGCVGMYICHDLRCLYAIYMNVHAQVIPYRGFSRFALGIFRVLYMNWQLQHLNMNMTGSIAVSYSVFLSNGLVLVPS